MQFDPTRDLRAAPLLSALGFDPRQVMRDLGEHDLGGLDLLGDGFDRVGNLHPHAVLNLLQRGAVSGLRMPLPFEARRSMRGWPEPEEGFDPSMFPPGSSGRRLAGLFKNDPFARQQLERALGGRIVPSSLSPSGFRVQRFAPGAFPGGGADNLAAMQAYSLLSGIDRGASASGAGGVFGAENAFQTMMMGAFGMMALEQAQRIQQRERQQRRRNFRILDTADLLGINPDGSNRGGAANAFTGMPGFGNPGFGGGFPGFGGGFSGFGGGAPSPTQGLFGIGGGGDTGAVLSDPGLTVEDKVTLLIMMIMKKMDQDIERQANYINALQQQQQGGGGKGGGGKGGKGGGGGGAPSIDVETMKLKRLIDKRSQMFDMLRQIIDKYNQTAKGIIDSMGR